MKNVFCLALMLLIFVGCADKRQRGVNLAVAKAINEFPDFRARAGIVHTFNLVKSVRKPESGFEIQLYLQRNDTTADELIIVFISPDNESFAIPFPSNASKAYWAFPFERQTSYTVDANSPFSKQLSSALDKATSGQNNRELLYLDMLDELFASVLNCQKIQERDSTLVYKNIYGNTHIAQESADSAFVRLRKNYEMMRKEWHPKKFLTNYNCYFDAENARIYQIRSRENGELSGVTTYRQDYGVRYFSL